MEAVSVRNVAKSFGPRTILRGVSFSVAHGEILCVIGKSGTGKSVILKHIAGLLRPDEGSIHINGEDLTASEDRERMRIASKTGVLFQGAALFDSMSVFDNVAFTLRRRGLAEDAVTLRVQELLAMVGLPGIGDRMPSEISGGTQKRVSLARSLAMEPSIMLYDEPTTGVDPITGGSVDALIARMNAEQALTSVVITHDMNSVERIAHRVVMLHEGGVIFDGSPEALMRSDDAFIQQFVQGRSS